MLSQILILDNMAESSQTSSQGKRKKKSKRFYGGGKKGVIVLNSAIRLFYGSFTLSK